MRALQLLPLADNTGDIDADETLTRILGDLESRR
jgi:hypothetical protein